MAMSAEGSVTLWLGQLKAGDAAAAEKLWERYFQRLVELGRKKLKGTPRRAADEEDVGVSAFESFFLGVAQGRFPRLDDRDDLWHVLVTLATRKASNLMKHERAQKRGGGVVLDEAALRHPQASSWAEGGLACVLGQEPTPEFAASVAEEYEGLLSRLQDEGLRAIAQWKLEGYNNHEIAERLSCAERTVERKLTVIRTLWGSGKSP
jgi:DNA-directed RNA polymerase specialized sigma24 family protein